jgi:rubrerythrin
MAEPTPPATPARPVTPLKTAQADDPATPLTVDLSSPTIDKMLCDRCGEEMYRMHAVWRCPACGFKTDCCGW